MSDQPQSTKSASMMTPQELREQRTDQQQELVSYLLGNEYRRLLRRADLFDAAFPEFRDA